MHDSDAVGGRAGGATSAPADLSESGTDGVPAEDYERSKNYVYRLLAMRDYSRAEVAAKLAGRDVPEDLACDLLDKFEEAGLIDDTRFAESFVRAKRSARGLARGALVHELRAKGVSGDIIEQAVAQVDPDDEERTARELVGRKAASSRGLDRAKRVRRLTAMLGRKGYPPGTAIRVVESVLAEEAPADEDAG